MPAKSWGVPLKIVMKPTLGFTCLFRIYMPIHPILFLSIHIMKHPRYLHLQYTPNGIGLLCYTISAN